MQFDKDAPSAKQVIYITLDGVRWQDVFLTPNFFPLIWEKYASQLTFYGAPDSGTFMQVASIPTSLPSYQSQTSGAVQDCDGNDCGRIKVETFPEALIRQYRLNKKEVATFSSWDKIHLAVEHREGATYTNIGNTPVMDPDSQQADSIMSLLNQQQENDHPGDGVRFDKYTIAQALHYFRKHQPRFLWIALNDSDDLAHESKLEEYHQILKFYDQQLDLLFSELQSLQLKQHTTVIVTTDHGRGNGDEWIEHGAEFIGSEQTWAFVMNGKLIPDFVQDNSHYYSTLSIRPTVESIFKST